MHRNKYLLAYKNFTQKYYESVDIQKDDELLGWSSKKNQYKRFQILHNLAKTCLDLKTGDSVVDAGCGYAAQLDYFLSQNCSYEYTGLEYNRAYLDVARKRYPQATFIEFDLLSEDFTLQKTYDVGFLSGVLNLNISCMYSDPEEKQIAKYAVIEFALESLLRYLRRGLVCNFLSSASRDQSFIFNYHNPKTLCAFLESRNFTIVKMEEGYLENDFSLVLQKN